MKEKVKISRQEQAMLTKIKIQDATKKMANGKGAISLSVKDICEEAGISVGGFYHHFPSIEFLVQESFSYDAHIEKILETNGLEGTPYQKLQTLFKYQMEYIENYGVAMMTLLYKSYIAHMDSGSDHYMVETRFMPLTIKGILQDAKKDGLFLHDDISVDEITNALLYLTRGTVFSWTMSNGTFNLPTEAHLHVRALLQGKINCE